MNDEEFRDYVNTKEVWAKQSRDALNKKGSAEKYLRETGASDELIASTLAHHDIVIAKYSAPYVRPEPENNIEGNSDGEPTRQDVMDRRAAGIEARVAAEDVG